MLDVLIWIMMLIFSVFVNLNSVELSHILHIKTLNAQKLNDKLHVYQIIV